MNEGSSGYVLLETLGGVHYDISYDPDSGDDVVMFDGVDEPIYLTKQDLNAMLEYL